MSARFGVPLAGTEMTHVAEDGDRWVGMVAGLVDDADEPRLEVAGMFVKSAPSVSECETVREL
jgi:hypothetical protein